MLHKFVDLYRIMIFMRAVDSQADRANESSVFAAGVNADKSWTLAMRVAVIGFDEIFETFRELLHLSLYRHIKII
jgi:hypothetical protein